MFLKFFYSSRFPKEKYFSDRSLAKLVFSHPSFPGIGTELKKKQLTIY